MIASRITYFYKTWYRVPFLVTYWGKEEIRTILASTISSGVGGGVGARGELKRVLAKRFGFSHVILTSTGRFAIEVALRSLGKPGGEVIVPTFVCRSVPEAVLKAGCVPVFADINKDLSVSVESVRSNLTDKTIAVLVAHLSGKPAKDLTDLVILCFERGISLIDDAA